MTNKKCQHKKYYKTSVNYKLTLVFSKLVGRMLKGQCNPKFAKYFMCSQKELKLYIEKQWLSWMTWDNYGIKGWVIDHIYPCHIFDIFNPTELKICFYYKNLQPLSFRENSFKAHKILPQYKNHQLV